MVSTLDTQSIEIIGHNRLVDELLLAGLEVALPLRDRGVDLITYVDLRPGGSADGVSTAPVERRIASNEFSAIGCPASGPSQGYPVFLPERGMKRALAQPTWYRRKI